MSNINSSRARAVADVTDGLILATVDIAATPERVFKALASKEICEWWVRPGVFDTREWTGDVRKGGRWRATGIGHGRPYAIEGEFLEVDPPNKLVHTWQPVGRPRADDRNLPAAGDRWRHAHHAEAFRRTKNTPPLFKHCKNMSSNDFVETSGPLPSARTTSRRHVFSQRVDIFNSL